MSDRFEEAVVRLPRHQLSDDEKQEQWHDLRDTIGGQSPPRSRRVRRIRKVAVVVGITACIAGAGVGTAAAFGVFSVTPTDWRVAHCYITDDLNDPTNQEDVALALRAHQRQPTLRDAAQTALELCASGWRQGRYNADEHSIHIAPLPPPWNHPVPPLVACVLPSGQVGVFPGGASTCATLGLPNALT